MRVLQLSTWQELCGIAGYTGDLVEALRARGLTVDVHPINRRERKYMSRDEVRAEWHAFAARAAGYDLVHVQHEFGFFAPTGRRAVEATAGVLGLLRDTGVPVVVTFHTDWPHQRLSAVVGEGPGRIQRARLWVVAQEARLLLGGFLRRHRARMRVIAHTRKSRLSLVEAGVPPGMISVIPVGVVQRDAMALAALEVSAKQQLGFPDDTVLLSIFGFVSHYKGYDLVLRALAHLPPNYRLAIIGGPHPEATGDRTLDGLLEILAADPELRERVRITGFADRDAIDLYHAATDICLATFHEVPAMAGSASITWALASGKPIIASKVPLFIELNEEIECMVLVTRDSPYELAWHIQRLGSDPVLRDRLVKNARQYAEENGWPAIAARVVAVYESLRGHGPPRGE